MSNTDVDPNSTGEPPAARGGGGAGLRPAAADAGQGVGIAIDLDGVLGDTRALWADWLAGAARVLGVDPAGLPEDRGAAAAALDASGGGNWRTLLERFAEERAPVYLRPNAEMGALLRRLQSGGTRLGVFTDAPEQLALVALAHVGATRRVEAVECGEGALERLLAGLGGDAVVARTRAELALAAQRATR